MVKKIKKFSLPVLIPVLVVSISLHISCRNLELFGGNEDDEFGTLIEDGKRVLGARDFARASQFFSKAVEIKPDSPEARFGLALSLIGIFFKNIEKVILELGSIVTQMLGISPPYSGIGGRFTPLSEDYTDLITEEVTLNDIVEAIISANLIEPIDKILENLEIPREKENWTFYVDKLSWVIKFEDRILWEIDISGEFDSSDANFLYSGFSFLESLLKLVLSVNIHLNFENLVRINEFISSIGGITKLIENPRLVVLSVLPFILNENENFLGVEPKRGVRYWTEDIPQGFLKSAETMLKTYELLTKEKDDQKDDIILVVEKENTEQGVVLRRIAFPSSSTYFRDTELIDAIGGSRILASMEIPSNFLEIFENIKGSFEGSRRAKWGNIIDTISFFLVAALKTGLFDTIINTFVNSAGSYGMPEASIQQILQIVDPQLISGIVKGIVPDVIEFDFKEFFSKPVGIRNLLPAWTEENSFSIEWECFSDSPKIIPLNEGNPAFMFLCKMPQYQYCFEESPEEICDIRIVQCYESLISTEDSGCVLFCPVKSVGEDESCEENQRKRSICLRFDENGERCQKYCAETRIRKLVEGNESQTCTISIEFIDTEHFSEFRKPGKGVISPSPIPKDEMTTIMPYLGFQSPDFYGLVYLDFNFLKLYDPRITKSGYQKPNQYDINLLLQVIGQNLERVLPQFGLIQ